jgi:hypothetical protein
MGITRDMVVQLLRLLPTTLVAFRNHLVTCTLTIGCMRPSEGAMAQSCELVYNSDYNLGLLQYQGSHHHLTQTGPDLQGPSDALWGLQ